MALLEKISLDLLSAMKAGERDRANALRGIKSAVKYREIEKGDELTDEDVVAVLSSAVKKHKDSIEQFEKAGRNDLVEKEKQEMKVAEEYLPEQLGEDEIERIVDTVISETGAAGPREFGIVMKGVMSKVKGQADGKLVKELVSKKLST